MNAQSALSASVQTPARSGPLARANLSCLALHGCFIVAALTPLLFVRVPALVDYPDHLARMWILARHGSLPQLAANYQIHWRILPDLAMDLIIPPISAIVSIETAGRVFIGLTIFALIGGTATLHRVLFGRWEAWPLWSALFVYNAVLFWGFLNCLFGIGIALFALSGWMATREWRPMWRIILFSPLACLLFLLHLFAFGFYGLTVGLYELDSRIRERRVTARGILLLFAAAAQFVPGLVLWHVSLEHSGPTVTAYGSFAAKLYALISPFTFSYVPAPLDVVTAILAFAFLAWAIRTRSLTLAAELRRPLAILAVVAIAMPNTLSGSWLTDVRLPVALVFLLIAGTQVRIGSRRMVVAAASISVCLFAARLWAVSQSWRDYDRQFAEFRDASRVIAPGSRLMIVEDTIPQRAMRLAGVPELFATRQSVAYFHMPELAIIDRAAFIPYVFTGWTTIDVAPRNRFIAESIGSPASPEDLLSGADPAGRNDLHVPGNIYHERPYWRDWPKHYDYVLWMDFGSRPIEVPPQLHLLTSGSFFQIFRIEPPVARAR